MVLTDFFLVLVIAAIVGAVFAYGLRRGGPWPSVLWFFVLLFFATWALGGWLRPWGPPVGDIYWVPYLFAALLIALLLAAATPVRPPPASPQTREVEQEAAQIAVALGVFFWLVLVLSLAAIALRYTWPP